MRSRGIIRGTLMLSLCMAMTSASLANPATGLDTNRNLKVLSESEKVGDLEVTRLKNGVQVRIGEMVKNVIFYGPETVRVNTTLGKIHTAHPSLVVLDGPVPQQLKITSVGGGIQIVGERLTVGIDSKSGALTFIKPDGSVILHENGKRPSELKQVQISGAPTYDVKQSFTLKDRESLYGMGQYTDPFWDYRGQEVYMVQSNVGICIPFLISTERYGILWDIYSRTIFKDGPEGMSLSAESAPAGVDYYFMAGNTMDDVILAYRELTGAAPMFSKKSFGLWMCKERYHNQKKVLSVARKFREVGFPIDNIIQDWQYWGGIDGTWSGMTWDKKRYPDPAGMIKTLHDDLNMQIMCSIWPSIGNDTALAKELDQYGLRHEPLHWISQQARVYDAYSDKGREIYYKHTKKGLLDIGVDGLWMDGTEVEVGTSCHGERNTEEQIKRLGSNAMGDYTRYLNSYTLMTTKGVYEGQRADSNKRVFTLTRSAWPGQQRYAALSWSGDTAASYKTLGDQVAGGLNVCMAGQPYWTQDIGGFFVGREWQSRGITNKRYHELFARWNQFGIFNPIYRIHGADIEREPYLVKDSHPEAYEAFLDAANLRYRLFPYIYGLAWQSTVNGYTMMRGMIMDYPDDPKVRSLYTQFTFGPAFLTKVIDRPIFYPEDLNPKDVIPAALFKTAKGDPGLEVEYYRGHNFDEFASKTIEPNVDQTWPGPPLTDLPKGIDASGDHFSARYEGVLMIPETGEYVVGTISDDGARLWLDDVQIVDDWKSHPAEFHGKKLSFTKGQKVRVKLEYFQDIYGRELKLVWKTPSKLQEEANTKVNDVVATYLPEGTWYDFWTNEKIAGGQNVSRSYPTMNLFPLYVRSGSIVPMGPMVQHLDERPDAPYEIRIYPGANADFTIYEDDGKTYEYEKGHHATIDLKWDDATRTLTIGERNGGFPEMIQQRKYCVVVASPNSAHGIPEAKTGVQTILYTGKVVKVQM